MYKDANSDDSGNQKEGIVKKTKSDPVWTNKVCVTFPWFSRKSAEDEETLAKLELEGEKVVAALVKVRISRKVWCVRRR